MTKRFLNLAPLHYPQQATEILEKFGRVEHREMNRKELREQIKEYEGLIIRFNHEINREIIDKAEKLEFIATAATGTDHIDVEYAKEKGIKTISLKGEADFLETIDATAEHTWGLILGIMRRIPFAYEDVLQNRWERENHIGSELKGKTLGVIGFGRLGKKVANYGKCFGMRVFYYDPYVNCGGEKTTLENLLRNADVVTIHVPLNESTKRMIGKKEMKMMKPGSFLINTSRGEVIDEQALVSRLGMNIQGAAVDVVTKESDIQNNPLIIHAGKRRDLLITPHIGGATKESMEKTEIFIAKKIGEMYLNGR